MSRSDRLIALALFAGYVALLLGTADTLGYARDEGFYFHAARAYGAWFELLFQDPGRALEQASVDRYFSVNREHPVLMKVLFALSERLFYDKLGWFAEQGTAYRFPGMLMAGLAVATIYAWARDVSGRDVSGRDVSGRDVSGRDVSGRVPALVAALSFAFMPRMFYHAHLACFDMPVAAMWLVTAYAYYRSLRAPGLWPSIAAGVLFGLLLNTKHNSWLLPPALFVHLLVTRGDQLLQGLRSLLSSRQLSLSRALSVALPLLFPRALLAMLVIGPVLFVLTWPWLWHDTWPRFREYVQFHTGHEYYNMEFLGRTYWKPPMPRLYAWVMTLSTVPAITLLLFGIGLTSSLSSLLSRLRRRHTGERAEGANAASGAERLSANVLWALGIAVSYAPWLSSDTPIFGGTKHWITAYPFLCLFAGQGFELVAARITALAGNSAIGAIGARGRWIAPLGAAACLAGPLVMTLHSHPWGLTFYTPLVGGAPGAATLGLNRTFWGYTTDAVLPYVNEHAPRGAAIYVHDTALSSYEMLRSDGRVRRDLRGTLAIHQSKLALYHHEPHMQRVEYQIWVDYGTAHPVAMGVYDGVPVVWLYQRP